MKKESIISSILTVVVLSIIIFATVIFFIYQIKWIGIIFIVLGILCLFVLEFFNRKIETVWPDIIFGIIDNGFLVIGALIGAGFAGVIGAIVGGAATNAITDGL